jgi:hypothetical protein
MDDADYLIEQKRQIGGRLRAAGPAGLEAALDFRLTGV